jgi:RNA polymerase sigma factor (sigma-70 family)
MGSNVALAQMQVQGGSKRKKQTKPTKLEIEKLIIEHRENGVKIAWRLLAGWRVKLNKDEVDSVVGISLCEAAQRYDKSKGASFITFLFYHIRGALLKEITFAMHQQNAIALNDDEHSSYAGFNTMYMASNETPLVEHNNPEKIFQQQEIMNACTDACSHLDDLEKSIIIRHYLHDEALNKISKELVYCRCHVSRVKTRALGKLKKLLVALKPSEKEIKKKLRKASNPKRSYTGGRGRRKTKGKQFKENTKLRKAAN